MFVTLDGEVHMYDNRGNKISTVQLVAIEDSSSAVNIVGIHWYDGTQGHEVANAPTLAIAFENGRVQVMRKHVDDSPVLIDTGMYAVFVPNRSLSLSVLRLTNAHVLQA